MTRVRIKDDFYIKKIADRPVAGNTATIIRALSKHSEIMIVEVDGLGPYGHHNGQLVLPPGSYEVVA